MRPCRKAVHPDAPCGFVARAHLQLSSAFDHVGRRSEATAMYRTAITETVTSNWIGIAASVCAARRTIE